MNANMVCSGPPLSRRPPRFVNQGIGCADTNNFVAASPKLLNNWENALNSKIYHPLGRRADGGTALLNRVASVLIFTA